MRRATPARRVAWTHQLGWGGGRSRTTRGVHRVVRGGNICPSTEGTSGPVSRVSGADGEQRDRVIGTYTRMSEADVNQVERLRLVREVVQVDPAVSLLRDEGNAQLESGVSYLIDKHDSLAVLRDVATCQLQPPGSAHFCCVATASTPRTSTLPVSRMKCPRGCPRAYRGNMSAISIAQLLVSCHPRRETYIPVPCCQPYPMKQGAHSGDVEHPSVRTRQHLLDGTDVGKTKYYRQSFFGLVTHGSAVTSAPTSVLIGASLDRLDLPEPPASAQSANMTDLTHSPPARRGRRANYPRPALSASPAILQYVRPPRRRTAKSKLTHARN